MSCTNAEANINSIHGQRHNLSKTHWQLCHIFDLKPLSLISCLQQNKNSRKHAEGLLKTAIQLPWVTANWYGQARVKNCWNINWANICMHHTPVPVWKKEENPSLVYFTAHVQEMPLPSFLVNTVQDTSKTLAVATTYMQMLLYSGPNICGPVEMYVLCKCVNSEKYLPTKLVRFFTF